MRSCFYFRKVKDGVKSQTYAIRGKYVFIQVENSTFAKRLANDLAKTYCKVVTLSARVDYENSINVRTASRKNLLDYLNMQRRSCAPHFMGQCLA